MSGRDARILVVFLALFSVFLFFFPKTRNLKWRYYKKSSNAVFHWRNLPWKLQRRVPSYIKSSINLFKLLLKESGWKTILIRNVAALQLRNFQCNVCLRKSKTLCRHALFEFLSGRIGSSGAHKRTLVAGKEELNFEDLQEGNNLLLK